MWRLKRSDHDTQRTKHKQTRAKQVTSHHTRALISPEHDTTTWSRYMSNNGRHDLLGKAREEQRKRSGEGCTYEALGASRDEKVGRGEEASAGRATWWVAVAQEGRGGGAA